MKLGQKAIFRRELVKGDSMIWRLEGIKMRRRPRPYMRYAIAEHEKPIEGIIAGVRNIGIEGGWGNEGSADYDIYEVLKWKKVYLVATDLRGFHRVPKEFILNRFEQQIAHDKEQGSCTKQRKNG